LSRYGDAVTENAYRRRLHDDAADAPTFSGHFDIFVAANR
jgi:hypothetical protein